MEMNSIFKQYINCCKGNEGSKGLVPVCFNRQFLERIKENSFVLIVHIWDSHNLVLKSLSPTHRVMVMRSLEKLRKISRHSKSGVYKFVVHKGLIHIDPFFTGLVDSPVYYRCVTIQHDGLDGPSRYLLGKLVIHLGGYVHDTPRLETEMVAYKGTAVPESKMDLIEVDVLLNTYREIYKRDYYGLETLV